MPRFSRMITNSRIVVADYYLSKDIENMNKSMGTSTTTTTAP